VARTLGVAALAGLGPAEADASPWVQPDGDTYARLAYAREEVSGLQASRIDAYAKHGLSDAWTVTGKVDLLVFDTADDFNANGYRLTLRRGFRQDKRLKFAVEGGLVGGEAISGFSGCEGPGGELRLSAGGGWRVKESDHFAFIDVVRREHSDACHRNRLEVGFGQDLGPKWQLISQFWLERGSGDARSDKSEVSLVRRTDWGDLSLAYRYEFSGRFDERAFVIALSREF
jgi:hypothetical protein